MKIRKNRYIFTAAFIALILYPLRWTFTGLDLWDSGYNCLNYVCFGLKYSKPAAFFPTFLASATGHVFSMLPFGDTYAGLRLYCGLIISVNVFISVLFCVNKLGLNKWAVLFGELLAVSLCYSPTVIIYNHLSFLLLTISIILLYDGLTGNKDIKLVIAGFVLGLNVYVRFPNITQAALILGVWYYLFIQKSEFKNGLHKTLMCIGGWLVSFALMYFVLGRIYGADAYIQGIKGLFGISEGAQDYSMHSMIKSMLGTYIRGFRRLGDVALFTVIAVVILFIIKRIGSGMKSDGRYEKTVGFVGVLSAAGLVIFFIFRQLMQFDFHHYITVILTAAMFIDVVIILSLVILFRRDSDDPARLIALLLILQIMVLSVGSNTGISPVMNCMFLTAPFMVHYLYLFLTGRKPDTDLPGILSVSERLIDLWEGTVRRAGTIVLVIALAAFYIQCVMFGADYVYEEAQNGRGCRFGVTDNRVLTGTRMSEKRAGWMQELTEYINKEKLKGHGAIVYGYAPSLLYYLSLEPVIGSWPDLDSYGISSMSEDIASLENLIDGKDKGCPVIIIDSENIKEQQEHNPEKWDILETFMKKYGYSEAFSTERFLIYRSRK